MRSNRIGELSVKPLVNTSSRCLFVLAVALAATAPSYSQGYILPDGVTCSSAGLSAVVHVMQSPTNGDDTGFILRPRFMTPGSLYYTIFSFDPAVPDEGVRTFFASQNDPFSLESIQAGAYWQLADGIPINREA
jgi:hypothetical protein